ncbi:hypothetical protein SAMN05421812_115124 [Asanoa hainanensis]|uniref:Lipoprotein LprG n=1 Tax=Asanoa hainanensis TaxID=560556 RepID=A0A239P9F5_9ACTN|nr:hypothetical protein [Asanoa hainanensis]SNT63513.1 hypothetical protein SAMN05421812_115124 [Asanoa hainanensis]
MRRVALVVAVGLLLAGCGNVVRQADRADEQVRAAVETMAKSSFSYHHTAAGDEYDGLVHRPSKSTTLRLSTREGAVTTETVLIGDRGWVRTNADLTAVGDAPPLDEISPWSEVTAETLSEPPFRYVAGADALVGAELFSSVSGLHETAPLTYAGTIDLTANMYLNATNGAAAPKELDQARAVPMTVTLDDRGHITRVTIDVPAAPTKSEFSDFDAVTAPTAPKS